MISNHPNIHIFGLWKQEHAGTMQVGDHANARVKDSEPRTSPRASCLCRAPHPNRCHYR